ncbi:MAG TPA: hypothetical protein VIV40_33165, partial [Kofleriaceae bacterium]
MASGRPPRDDLPDARDGLTRLQRIILWQLREAQRETGRDSVPTAMLYGRVLEHIDVSIEEFQAVLNRLVGSGAHE